MEQIEQFFAAHWKETLLLLASIFLIRVVKFLLRMGRRRKELRKEKELEAIAWRDKQLDDEILNPERREGDVTEQKRPYQVFYTDKGAPGRKGNRDGGHLRGRIPGGSRSPGAAPNPDALLKVTEKTRLSRKLYTYRNSETMRVGNQYGNTGILAEGSGDAILYFEIFSHEGQFYIRSTGSVPVTVIRGGSRKELGGPAVLLRENDMITVLDRVYEIGFIQ
ncbi:MAG: hypothetical protein Q4D81_01240 [Eubacteriales bacterium]|nr:hypothetical protein [Eubacteriales bacterium]